MKQYVGRFPVNAGLTKKLGYEDFQIYRDTENGLYAYSKNHDIDVNLMTWNETVANCTDDECSYWSELITDAIMENEPIEADWDGIIIIR